MSKLNLLLYTILAILCGCFNDDCHVYVGETTFYNYEKVQWNTYRFQLDSNINLEYDTLKEMDTVKFDEIVVIMEFTPNIVVIESPRMTRFQLIPSAYACPPSLPDEDVMSKVSCKVNASQPYKTHWAVDSNLFELIDFSFNPPENISHYSLNIYNSQRFYYNLPKNSLAFYFNEAPEKAGEYQFNYQIITNSSKEVPDTFNYQTPKLWVKVD